jgi:hypothetical protein
VPLDDRERARTKTPALVQIAADYDYERDHTFMKRVSAAKFDYFLEVGGPLGLFALWWDDKRATTEYLLAWEKGEMCAIAEGDYPQLECSGIIPVMRVILAQPLAMRVLKAAGISWREAELQAESWAHWSLPDEAAFCFHAQYGLMVAKLECFLCGPDQVEISEVLEYLPQADSCKWARDNSNQIHFPTESLGVRISKAALTCGALLELRVERLYCQPSCGEIPLFNLPVFVL